MAFGGMFSFVCLVIRFLIVLAYLCVGAAVFRTLEVGGKGSTGGKDVKPEIKQYFDWFQFAFSCTTTIGYRGALPTKTDSKLFFIFYTLVGIPLMFWYLALCGQIQTGIYRYVLQQIRTRFWKQNDKSYRDVGPVFISCINLIIFWLVGAILVHKTTQLSLVDCVYYWFVIFTTNGFSDVTLSTNDKENYSWIVYKWFLLNLVAAILNSVLVWIHGFSEPRQSMCCMCWHRDEVTSEDPDESLARYHIQVAKKQEAIQLHRQMHR